MPTSRLDLMRWQFDLTWSLLEYHLEDLDAEDFWWEPAPLTWTMRRGPDGSWEADFAETEPTPVPVPTIAWVSWHLGWWWTTAIDHARGRGDQVRGNVGWPGESAATAVWLRGLREEWLGVLDTLTDADLDGPATFPWGDAPEKTLAHMVAWVNAELMKNVAEIGHVRILRGASHEGDAGASRG